jgi:hypothetical protein
MSLKVLGLTGFKQCGKSTLAKAVLEVAKAKGRTGAIYSFAKPLKEVCHILFGGNEDNWYGDLKTEKFPEWSLRLGERFSSPRRIMQTMGTEVCRNHIDQEFWLMVADRYIADMVRAEHLDFVIIDDVRFDNEAQFVVTNFNGTIARIQRVAASVPYDLHVSERGVSNNLIDYTYTCGGLDCVRASAIDIFNRGHV